MPDIALVLLAGAVAGTMNAIGGGGTFVALPALVAAGLPPRGGERGVDRRPRARGRGQRLGLPA
ncbi:hypothetical protein [Streptomyces niveus]|uniref:hypothetical protein n=1 Tax=Streptomyces niveus TaxID=193462 RepID=UPI003426166F